MKEGIQKLLLTADDALDDVDRPSDLRERMTMPGTRQSTKRKLFATDRASRFADLIQRYSIECEEDGRVTETQLTFIRKIAYLQCSLEDLEQSYVTSGSYAKERAEYQRLAGTQARLMRSIGLVSSASHYDPDDDFDDQPSSREMGRPRRLRRERLPEED